MINVFDFEVYSHDWMVVINNPIEKKETIIVNNSEELIQYYESHKDQIWVSYNGRHYDTYIMKGILCGFLPQEINDFIIVKNQPGWKFSSLFRKIQFNNFDIMTTYHGLKMLEGYQGHNIKETSIPFNINRKLTDNELDEVIEYCKNDVIETLNIFIKRKDEFDSVMGLIKTFKLPLHYISKTKAQLSATILGCSKTDRDDEWEIEIIDTLKIKKYQEVVQWFTNPLNHDYKKSLKIDIAGVPTLFGWGGVHSARTKYHSKGFILHVDVNSFYPAIMIEYDLLSRNVSDKNKYREIRDLRLKYKKEKNPLQAPYKIVLNATFGICKDKYSSAYDPKQANNICINGQLLLLDLIEHLELVPSFELIQSNTDGLIIKIDKKDFELTKSVCNEWENRTRMGLGYDYITEIWQKDVNNYLFTDDSYTGKLNKKGDYDGLERKGSYVKSLNSLDNDLPIVNKSLINYFLFNIQPEETINSCYDLIEFQKIVKVSGKYKYALHGDKILKEKILRVFASRSKVDKGVYKVHNNKDTPDKIANTPERCFIENGDLNGVKVPRKLDKQYYINLAKKRISDFIGGD